MAEDRFGPTFHNYENHFIRALLTKNHRLRRIFSAAQRCDDTVTEYLVRLQTLLTSHYSSDSDIAQALNSTKTITVDSVDTETCIASYPYEPLESLSKHAGSILARKS